MARKNFLTDMRLHRSIFRLHFYAGLLVAPFLLILSITGAIYLFNTEIEDIVFGDWRFASAEGPHLAPEVMVDGALAAYPASTATRIDLPVTSERTATVFLTPEMGEPFRVFVDPVTGVALGSFIYGDTLVGFADKMHGSLLIGDRGSNIVELASCWAIVLIMTGLYLWWPRGGGAIWGVFLPRRLKGRLMWREIHAVVGMWASVFILFLIVTGLPWSAHWSGYLQGFLDLTDSGYPASYRTHVNHAAVMSDPTTTLAETTPGIAWTLESAPAPMSDHGHHQMAGAEPIDVGTAASILAREGLTTAYRLVYPKDKHDVFTAYTYPDKPEGQRTIHLDQYTGDVINDIAYADYGVGAKAVELGVQLHMGNYFGVPNQIIMLFAALCGVALAITGPVMWLKRRKAGLGAPPPASGKRAWSIAVILLAFGVVFPALGLSLIAVFAAEQLILGRIAPVRQWLGLRS
ncbi:PepSY-associated TM helix domain-containing protein [Kordiimonas sp.]|uniref:PepSY-associated TM helix domain-containing protein n=1 Tax=Kordiimonas sp. TaxID=1970157 RepID=UPI003A94146C